MVLQLVLTRQRDLQSQPRTTRVADLVSLVLGTLLILGVFVDGWAHLNLPGLESFFTPWHGLLYASLTVNAAWMAMLGWRGLLAGRPLQAVLPAGYGLGAVGLAIFGLGGLGDMIWHVFFGVETAIDALISPTHLVLFAGGMLILTSPLRARLAENGLVSQRSRWVATGSAAISTALAAFFLLYTSVFAEPAPIQPFRRILENEPEHDALELPVALGLAGYLVTTALLVVPLLFLLRRDYLPPGGVTFMVAVIAWLSAGVVDFVGPAVVSAVGASIGAAIADIVISRFRPAAPPVRRLVTSAAVLPLMVWTGQLVGLAISPGLGWTPELVLGVVPLTAAVGGVLGAVATPRRVGRQGSAAGAGG